MTLDQSVWNFWETQIILSFLNKLPNGGAWFCGHFERPAACPRDPGNANKNHTLRQVAAPR